jgi:hypothetical protein
MLSQSTPKTFSFKFAMELTHLCLSCYNNAKFKILSVLLVHNLVQLHHLIILMIISCLKRKHYFHIVQNIKKLCQKYFQIFIASFFLIQKI